MTTNQKENTMTTAKNIVHVHCCNNVPKERQVHMINGHWTYRCDCGDTIFVDPDRARTS